MALSKWAQEILIGASKIISDRENWTQGTLHTVYNGDDKVCSLGAVYKAADDIRTQHGKPRKWLDTGGMRVCNPVLDGGHQGPEGFHVEGSSS